MKRFSIVGIILFAAVLRFWQLGQIPPSLYWDEASLGYNAYSILLTARDEHSKFIPVTNFAAFGDYKPPGYIYAAVPSVALFGLNEFSIRFPSAFFGVMTVVLAYLIAKRLFQNEIISLFSALFLAISPWHLQFSRGAFEANLGLFFSTLGIYLFLKFAKDKSYYLLFSAFAFLAAMYTFTGQRLFIPFLLVILVIQFRERILANFRIVVLIAIISSLLFWPLFTFTAKTIEGKLRFNEVSIFKELKPINDSIRYREIDHFSWWSDSIHNRRLFYAHEYLVHYFDAFDPGFLFSKGDVNPRLSVQEVGELYLIDLPLILAGIYFLFSQKNKYRWLIIGWLLISPLGPATARETPHALRMIHILPTYQLISAFGLYYFYKAVKFKKLFISFIFLLLISNFIYYLHMYYLHCPKKYSGEWQYGYKQAVEIAKFYYSEVDNVIITKYLGRPYIYFLLYNKYDPKLFWQTAKITRDQFYFLDVEGFDKFSFTNDQSESNFKGKTIFIVSTGELPTDAKKVASIYNLRGDQAFEVGITSR